MGLAELQGRVRQRLRASHSVAPTERTVDGPSSAPDEEQRAARSLYPLRERQSRMERHAPATGAPEGNEGELARVSTLATDLARQALRDPLTDLLNRRALADRLAGELARAERDHYPVALAAVDIDFFKQTNDLGGHAVGDAVLRAMAERLLGGIRPGDHAGRVGGDELMLVLVDADAELATEVLGRIEHAVGALEFEPGHPAPSFSAGIAEFPRDATKMSELMERADEALFRAKAQGRQRVCTYSSEAASPLGSELGASERHQLYLQNTVEALARAVDARNGYTHLHSHAVAAYAVALARALEIREERIELIRRAAVLHDVGKIGVPDAVLWKEASLAPAEVELIRRHSATGHDILLGAGLPEIARWVGSLHERPDGLGYPDGLEGEAIPLESRLLAVVDAFDAMTCPRLYREPLAVEDAMRELEHGAGTQFDPELVALFCALVGAGHIDVRARRAADWEAS
jgi:diguanylate cyclase (GGDEF)-like protein